jgi:hypothetical protein
MRWGGLRPAGIGVIGFVRLFVAGIISVPDPRMVHAAQCVDKRATHGIEVFQGQIRSIQLPLGKPVLDYPAHDGVNLILVLGRLGPRLGLDPVGQHEQGGFLRPGRGPGYRKSASSTLDSSPPAASRACWYW